LAVLETKHSVAIGQTLLAMRDHHDGRTRVEIDNPLGDLSFATSSALVASSRMKSHGRRSTARARHSGVIAPVALTMLEAPATARSRSSRCAYAWAGTDLAKCCSDSLNCTAEPEIARR